MGAVAYAVSGGCVFFQAEDGIRGYDVTGVQTCALPILHGARPRTACGRGPRLRRSRGDHLAHCGWRDHSRG